MIVSGEHRQRQGTDPLAGNFRGNQRIEKGYRCGKGNLFRSHRFKNANRQERLGRIKRVADEILRGNRPWEELLQNGKGYQVDKIDEGMEIDHEEGVHQANGHDEHQMDLQLPGQSSSEGESFHTRESTEEDEAEKDENDKEGEGDVNVYDCVGGEDSLHGEDDSQGEENFQRGEEKYSDFEFDRVGQDEWNQQKDELDQQQDGWNQQQDELDQNQDGWNQQQDELDQHQDGWNQQQDERNQQQDESHPEAVRAIYLLDTMPSFIIRHRFLNWLCTKLETSCSEFMIRTVGHSRKEPKWTREALLLRPELRPFEPCQIGQICTDLWEWKKFIKQALEVGVLDEHDFFMDWCQTDRILESLAELRHGTVHRSSGLELWNVESSLRFPELVGDEDCQGEVNHVYALACAASKPEADEKTLNEFDAVAFDAAAEAHDDWMTEDSLLVKLQQVVEKDTFYYIKRHYPNSVRDSSVPEMFEMTAWHRNFQRYRAIQDDFLDTDGQLLRSVLWEGRLLRNDAVHRNGGVRHNAHAAIKALMLYGQYKDAVEVEILIEQYLTDKTRREVLLRLRDVYLADDPSLLETFFMFAKRREDRRRAAITELLEHASLLPGSSQGNQAYESNLHPDHSHEADPTAEIDPPWYQRLTAAAIALERECVNEHVSDPWPKYEPASDHLISGSMPYAIVEVGADDWTSRRETISISMHPVLQALPRPLTRHVLFRRPEAYSPQTSTEKDAELTRTTLHSFTALYSFLCAITVLFSALED